MKNIKHICKSACLLGLIVIATTSCEDWLTIYPQDRVVEENFWEDKNDLDGVRYGAYKQMASTIGELAIWGDLRSDAYNLNTLDHSDQGNRERYNEIIKGMPDSSMNQFDWEGVYKTINFCNKVLQHGPEVLAKDKQFTYTEWQYMRAEMVALRALNYFYLIRAFKDIPYSTKVINSDAEVETFGLTNQLVVLDSLILDCESVKGQARNRFADVRDSKGMITNCAIYAILADMYLWRASLHEGRYGINGTSEVQRNGITYPHTVKGDYQQAADYADMALASLHQQNTDAVSSSFNTRRLETINYGLTNCDLIKNDFEGLNQSTTPLLEAHTAIFETKNSEESIFELQFSSRDDRKNDIVNSLYGSNNGTHLMVCEESIKNCFNGSKNLYDSRIWYSCQNLLSKKGSSSSASTSALAGYYCIKWATDLLPRFDGVQSNRELKAVVYAGESYCNWIIYRMAEVMLIKAEALACIATANNSTEATECHKICKALRWRAYGDFKTGKQPPTDASSTFSEYMPYPSISNNAVSYSLVQMVMNERLLELIGEGKRWFDLVRFAERYSYYPFDEPKSSNSGSGSSSSSTSIDTKKKSTDELDEREGTEENKITNGGSGMNRMVYEYMRTAYSQLYTSLKNRFKNRYGLYCPIYEMEVKASEGAIKQNPVWNKSKYEQ